jgi:hypothetical protein
MTQELVRRNSVKRLSVFAAVVSLFVAGAALAQEHWTEGSVWQITFYRTTPATSTTP